MIVSDTKCSEIMKELMISVVVCTYNRADLLSDVLKTLVNQSLNESFYEIIVIDNNSKDNTCKTVKELQRNHHNIRYVLENRQGLSYARNRGWQESNSKYVAYIDDDCKVPEQWLAVAKSVIENISPSVFGGPFYPFYNGRKPKWYKDSYGTHEPGKEARILNGKECVNIYGGNMFFKRTVLKSIGGFDPKFGMSGNKIAYSEETVLLKAISNKMPDQIIYYDPQLFLYHLVKQNKMKLFSIASVYFIHGRYNYYHSENKIVNLNLESNIKLRFLVISAKIITAFAFDFAFSFVRNNRKQYPYIQNYLKEHTFKYLMKLGMTYEKYTQINK